MRLLGPNSLGLLAPWQGLNASFSPVPIKRGKLAFISQSAAVSNTILTGRNSVRWAFPYFIALGDSLDIMLMNCSTIWRATVKPAPSCSIEQLSDARRFRFGSP
ncbi:hypothetical protein ACVXHB_20405 [Escherichia coli]